MAATFHAKAILEDPGASKTVALTISAGDSIVVFGGWDHTASPMPTVKITDGTFLPLIVGPTAADQTTDYAVWLIQSVGAGNSDFTIACSGTTPAYGGFWAESFSGLSSPILDQSASAHLANCTTMALNAADEFAVELALSAAAVTAIGAPWTSDGISPSNSWGGGHRVLTTTAPLTSNFTGQTDCYIWTFRSGGGAIDPQLPLMPQILT